MTSLSSDDTTRSFEPSAATAFEVTWTATRIGSAGSMTSRFTIQLRLVDDEHVVVHAWTEHDGATAIIVDHQPFPCTVHRDGGESVHLDVRDAADTLGAFSISGDRLLYARTALLSRTGYSSASWDPPQMRRIDAAELRQRA